MDRFSSMVKVGMRDAGVTLRELCRQAELDPSFLSKVLAGKRSPPAEEAALRRIAQTLRLMPAELVVAAGRVPSEWRRLREDPRAFDAVHRLLTGAGRPATSNPRSASSKAEPRALKPLTFADELL